MLKTNFPIDEHILGLGHHGEGDGDEVGEAKGTVDATTDVLSIL